MFLESFYVFITLSDQHWLQVLHLKALWIKESITNQTPITMELFSIQLTTLVAIIKIIITSLISIDEHSLISELNRMRPLLFFYRGFTVMLFIYGYRRTGVQRIEIIWICLNPIQNVSNFIIIWIGFGPHQINIDSIKHGNDFAPANENEKKGGKTHKIGLCRRCSVKFKQLYWNKRTNWTHHCTMYHCTIDQPGFYITCSTYYLFGRVSAADVMNNEQQEIILISNQTLWR